MNKLIKLSKILSSLLLNEESTSILKLANSEEDITYMRAASLLSREIMNYIVPTIEKLDSHWSRSAKIDDLEELKERLGTIGFNINKNTPAGVTVSYKDGNDHNPSEITIMFSSEVFSPEVQSVLTNKRGLKRNFFVTLNLNDSHEADGGGSSINLSVKDILSGGTNHNVNREFWEAFEIFTEQIYHEVIHLERSGSSPDSGVAGTIRYLATPGEIFAHAGQVAILYFNQFRDDDNITWDKIFSMRFPRESSRVKVLNYFNLSQPDRIQKYQALVPDVKLNELSETFLNTVNNFYKQIKQTH